MGSRSGMGVAAALVALALLAALALTACGGGSSSDGSASSYSESGSAITKAALIKQGDEICANTDKRQDEALKSFEKLQGKPTGNAATEKAIKVVALPPIKVEINELAALGAPAADEAQIQAIITGFKKALSEVEGKPSLLMSSSEGPFEAPDKLAATYGFKECAKAL
jgi:hypothetical protein